MTKRNNILASTLFSLILIFILSACGRAETAKSTPVGGLWDIPVEDGQLNWDKASPLAQEQYSGFELANQKAGFIEVNFAEGNQKDDVQTAVRKMVEGQAEGSASGEVANDPVIAVLGATSNEASSREAALANFFNVPMLIPSASGDNLLPDNNLWAFQLSAPNSAYVDYMLGTVLTKQTLSSNLEDDFSPEIRVAILYEQNTYGESTAVTAATLTMQQEFEVMVYEKFPAETPSLARMRTLVNKVVDQDAQMVFVISSNPNVSQMLIETFNDLIDKRAMPLLVGVAAGFTSQNFLESSHAEDIFILRQDMSGVACPEEIETLYAAQNYDAVKLLEYALEEAPKVDKGKSTLSLNKEETLSIQRENLRDTLKIANMELPCLGQIAFDNTGQNKFLRFEILKVTDGELQEILSEDFLLIAKEKFGLAE